MGHTSRFQLRPKFVRRKKIANVASGPVMVNQGLYQSDHRSQRKWKHTYAHSQPFEEEQEPLLQDTTPYGNIFLSPWCFVRRVCERVIHSCIEVQRSGSVVNRQHTGMANVA